MDHVEGRQANWANAPMFLGVGQTETLGALVNLGSPQGGNFVSPTSCHAIRRTAAMAFGFSPSVSASSKAAPRARYCSGVRTTFRLR